MKCVLTFAVIFLTAASAVGQTAPCDLTYGSEEDAENITLQMYSGTIEAAIDALTAAKNTRGVRVGCPEIEITYSPADFDVPALSEITTVWNTAIKPEIESYTIDCPRIGRYENNLGLGAYYAKQADYFDNLPSLAAIGNMMEAQQFTSNNYSGPINTENLGVFGYIHVAILNPCYPGGVVGSSVDAVCDAIPEYCVNYDLGLYAGKDFLIGDQNADYDFYDGGIAYDHGWVGVTMIEAAIAQSDITLKAKYKSAAIAAAQWATNEKTVRNHNYTAKLIWLLAELYAWSGQEEYKTALNYRLEKNLIPGVLMDLDEDGEVDGMSPTILFSELSEIAQRPGRMWDGHNALPWYNAMNAWAMTEAYIAFRDQEDIARATELKPYAIAMLDNLAWEVNNFGVIPNQLGIRDLAYGLLIGIWKIAQYEDEEHSEWESAAWALWNSGYFNEISTHSVCVGLYLNIREENPYKPLHERSDFNAIPSFQNTTLIHLYPNPSSGIFQIESAEKIDKIEIFSLNGQLILATNENTDFIDLREHHGVFVVRVQTSQVARSFKVQVQ